ncbi:hypothetical protein DA798_07700 [Lactobacillus sp. PFC-70]|nr:hypothetical protein DA798_07700 [Lactobacillus sp. PFC-70]
MKPTLLALNESTKVEQLPRRNTDYKSNMIKIWGYNNLDWTGLQKYILVFTQMDDPEFDQIAPGLLSIGINYLRVNSENFLNNFRMKLTFKNKKMVGTFSNEIESVNLQQVSGIWFRHFSLDNIVWPKSVDKVSRSYIKEQWETLFETLNHADTWIISPFEMTKKLPKPVQLGIAQQIGFKIPPTIITNDNAWLDTLKLPLFLKAVRNHSIIVNSDRLKKVYGKTIYSPKSIKRGKMLLTPSIAQKYYKHNSITEVRVTAFGDNLIADQYVNVESDDWHNQGINGVEIKAYELPNNVEDMVKKVLAKAKVSIATVDLFQSNGYWYFLEINSVGDWKWLENKVKQPFSKSCLNYLKKGVFYEQAKD